MTSKPRQLPLVSFLIFGMVLSCFSQTMQFPGAEWDRPSPEEAVVYAERLAAAKAKSEEMGATSVMIVKDGVAIAEWGDVSHSSNLHSIRKGILSALIGIGVEQKKIDLETTIGALGIDDNEPSLTDQEKQATVHDLLKARSAIFHPALYESQSMKDKRPERGSETPGNFWYYNNWDFNALGTIYEQQTGKGIFSAVVEELAVPLQMQDFKESDGHYVSGPDSKHRAYPMKMSARDLARFALLYLDEGRWKDRQLLPMGWVKASATPYSATDDGGGYGYMWWTHSRPDGTARSLPGAYYASGVGGQSAYIIPSDNLVVVFRVDTAITEKRVKRFELKRFVELVTSSLKN